MKPVLVFLSLLALASFAMAKPSNYPVSRGEAMPYGVWLTNPTNVFSTGNAVFITGMTATGRQTKTIQLFPKPADIKSARSRQAKPMSLVKAQAVAARQESAEGLRRFIVSQTEPLRRRNASHTELANRAKALFEQNPMVDHVITSVDQYSSELLVYLKTKPGQTDFVPPMHFNCLESPEEPTPEIPLAERMETKARNIAANLNQGNFYFLTDTTECFFPPSLIDSVHAEIRRLQRNPRHRSLLFTTDQAEKIRKPLVISALEE